jgi:hypothetical protein
MTDARIRELVAELEGLIPREDAQVILHDDGDSIGSLPMCATRNGFLRFGLAFMKAAFAEARGRGSNGGEKVDVDADLDALYRSDSNVEFQCERAASIPDRGDRRRAKEVPGPIGIPVVIFVVVCFLVGLYHVCGAIRSQF